PRTLLLRSRIRLECRGLALYLCHECRDLVALFCSSRGARPAKRLIRLLLKIRKADLVALVLQFGDKLLDCLRLLDRSSSGAVTPARSFISCVNRHGCRRRRNVRRSALENAEDLLLFGRDGLQLFALLADSAFQKPALHRG